MVMDDRHSARVFLGCRNDSSVPPSECPGSGSADDVQTSSHAGLDGRRRSGLARRGGHAMAQPGTPAHSATITSTANSQWTMAATLKEMHDSK